LSDRIPRIRERKSTLIPITHGILKRGGKVYYAATHFGVMAAMGLLLLIPYWIFRPLVRPLPGFSGY